MGDDLRTIRIYTMPQENPCGPASGCCGPVGQTEEELAQLRCGLERVVPGVPIEVVNVRQKLNTQRDAAVLRVLQTFGFVALPILAVNGQIISIGPPQVPELVSKLRELFPSSASPEPYPSP